MIEGITTFSSSGGFSTLGLKLRESGSNVPSPRYFGPCHQIYEDISFFAVTPLETQSSELSLVLTYLQITSELNY